MASVNDEIRDKAIRHALYLQRFGNGLTEQVIALLDEASEEIVAKLAARLASIDERGLTLSDRATKRLQMLLDEIKGLNAALYGQIGETLSEQLSGLGSVEAQFQAATLQTVLPVAFQTAIPSPTRLRAIIETSPMEGALLSSWTEGVQDGTAKRIEQAIRKGMVQGLGTDDLVRSIRGTKKQNYKDGVLEISRRSARSIVRTSVSHVSNVAAQETWKANERVVKGWQYVSTLDSRTTITCAALNGQVFPVGEGPMPPRHIGCRSLSIAVTKSFKEMGFDSDEVTASERASMDGKVAGDITFEKWLKDKGEGTQNDILGPTRAALFRDGKLSLQDFIKNDGTVLTIEQLSKIYKI